MESQGCELMRLGIAAADTPKWPKVDWVAEAAQRLGHDVVRAKTAAELPTLFNECNLVILGQKSLAGRWPNVRDAIANRKCPCIYWWFDLLATTPGEYLTEQPLFQTFAKQFKAVDLSLVKEAGILSQYRDAGCKAEWFDQGCPSNMPAIQPVAPEWDMLVWGQSGSYHERCRSVSAAIDAGFTVAWAGGGNIPAGAIPLPWTMPLDLPKLASRARCVLSSGLRNDLQGFWSDGFWLAVGMGATVLRAGTPGLPDGPFVTYHSNSSLCASLSWLKHHPDEAATLGRQARKWVMENHTIEHRVRALLSLAAKTVMARGLLNGS